jgi:hypothetical protein
MKRKWIFLAMVFLMVTAAAGQGRAAAVNMQEGEWENTVEMKMEGMPFAIPPVKTTQCMTKEDYVPKQKEGKGNCTVKNQKVTGNKVTWSQECIDESGAKTEAQGEITYSGSSYKGTMSMKTRDESGEVMTSTAVMNGRRIGACTDKSKKKMMVGDQEVKQPDAAMMAQAKQAQADFQKRQAENRTKSAEFVKLSAPAEDSGSCVMKGNDFIDSPDCNNKVGKMNLNQGEWEITTTQAMKAQGQPDYTVGDPEKKTECLGPDAMAPSMIREGSAPREIRRTAKKITWKQHANNYGITVDERGGINYQGDTLDGVVVKKQTDSGGNTIEFKTKIIGKRIGKGSCAEQRRDYTSQRRDYTSQKRKTPSSSSGVGDAVNKLKGLFGK